jgi:hypothetical protein
MFVVLLFKFRANAMKIYLTDVFLYLFFLKKVLLHFTPSAWLEQHCFSSFLFAGLTLSLFGTKKKKFFYIFPTRTLAKDWPNELKLQLLLS